MKTNNHGDAELSYLQAYKDSGVGGGIRSTGIFVLRTHSRKVATARQRQQVRTKTTALQSRGAADERSKTNSHHDADAYFNDYGYLTVKDNVSEVGTARRSSSFHGLIRRTWRWRYGKISVGTSSTSSCRKNEEDVGDIEDI